jgi:hypothetical protein
MTDLMETTMHCPDCGSEAPASQKFCRACGLNLERFAQLLAEMRSDTEDEIAALTRRRWHQLEKAGKIIFVTVGSVIWTYFTLAGILSINAGQVGMGLLSFGLGVGSIAAFLIGTYCTPLGKKISIQPLPAAENTNNPLHQDQPSGSMSVTEHTTARLEEKIKPGRCI